MRLPVNRSLAVAALLSGIVGTLLLPATARASAAQDSASPSTAASPGVAVSPAAEPISSGQTTSPKSAPPEWGQFQGDPAHQGTWPSGDALQPPYARAWSFARPDSEDDLSNPVIDGGTVFVAGVKVVHAVALDGGQQLWSMPREESDSLTAPAVAITPSKHLLLFTQGKADKSELVALDEETHKQAWVLPLDDDSRSGVTVVGTTAFVGEVSGKLSAVDTQTGKLLWSLAVANASIDSPPAVDGNTVYVATVNRSTSALKIAAISLTTHKQLWSYTSPVPSSALTVADGRVMFGVNIGNQAGRAVALDATSGHVAWTELLRSPVFSITGGAFANGTFFVVDLSGGLFAFDASTGSRKWDFQFNPVERTQFGYEDFAGPPAVAGKFVLVGLADGRLAAVDTTTGHLAWNEGTGVGALQAVAMAPESLVVTKSGDNGGVLAFHAGSGPLTDISSPTTIDLWTVFINYALAFLLLAAIGIGAGLLLRKRRASKPARAETKDETAKVDELVVIEDPEDGPDGTDGTDAPDGTHDDEEDE